MNYDEFKAKVKESLEEYFGDTAEVRVKSVMKNNGVTRYGVTIFCNKCNLSPTIYLEEFFARVQNGEVYAQIIHEIITIFEEHKDGQFWYKLLYRFWKRKRQDNV